MEIFPMLRLDLTEALLTLAIIISFIIAISAVARLSCRESLVSLRGNGIAVHPSVN